MKIYSGFNWKSLKEPDKTKSLMLEEETDEKKQVICQPFGRKASPACEEHARDAVVLENDHEN